MEEFGSWLGSQASLDRARALFLPLTAELLSTGVDPSEVNAKAAGLYQYAFARRMSSNHNLQAVTREIIPLLEAACNGAWDSRIKVQSGRLLLDLRRFANFTDDQAKFDNIWAVITMLTDVFGNPPPDSDAKTLTGYWNLQAEGWHFVSSAIVASDDLRSTARDQMVKAAEALERLGDPLGAARWWIQLSYEYAVKNPTQAAAFLERARPVMESTEELPFGASGFHNALAHLAERRGEMGVALAAYARAAELDLSKPLEDLRWNAKLPLANRALLLMKLRRWAEANSDLSTAIALEEQHIHRLPTIPQNSPMTSFESQVPVLSSFTQPLYSDMASRSPAERPEESFNWSERARASNLRRQIWRDHRATQLPWSRAIFTGCGERSAKVGLDFHP